LAASKKSRLHSFLSQGGAKIARHGGTVEIWSKHGDKRERETAAGERTAVTGSLDPRLKLSTQQRAIGSCYGAYCEAVLKAGSNTFLREHVDGGRSGGGGATDRTIHILRMVEVAHVALRLVDPIIYPVGRARGEKRVGSHHPISARDLIDAICLHGQSLELVAIRSGWVMERAGGKRQGAMVVPDRQRKRLAAGLRDVLDLVGDAWEAKGYAVPYQFMTVEME
jgi:hypothetical protein